MLLILLLGLLVGTPDAGAQRLSPVSAAEFERTKTHPELDRVRADRDASIEASLTAALAVRGYSGDRIYLQGCDLYDQQADYQLANLELILASPDWATYEADWRAVLPDIEYDDHLPAGSTEEIAHARAIADQSVRKLLTDPLPDGERGKALFQLRSVNSCIVDLHNGEWLQSPAAVELFETTTDAEVLHDLYLLAMHSDHLPRLQDRFADIYLARHKDLGLPIEPGLRLKDRSSVNFGQLQPYATGVICQDGKPVFAGATDLASANAKRAAVGLPPQDLDEKLATGFCGRR